jgi:anti-anti-sigma regulatory factor
MRVAGPVDVTTAERFAGRLLSACRAGTVPLTVDLTAVTILASAGVRALGEVSAQLAAHGCGAASLADLDQDLIRAAAPVSAQSAG